MSSTYTVQEYTVTQQKKITTSTSSTVDESGYISAYVIYRTRVNVVVTAVDRVVTAITKRLLSPDGKVLSSFVTPTTIVSTIQTNYVETSYYMPDQTVFLGIQKSGTSTPVPI